MNVSEYILKFIAAASIIIFTGVIGFIILFYALNLMFDIPIPTIQEIVILVVAIIIIRTCITMHINIISDEVWEEVEP